MEGHNFDGSPMANAKTGAVIVGSGRLYSTERAAERLNDHAAYPA
jgi:hypothetical protein